MRPKKDLDAKIQVRISAALNERLQEVSEETGAPISELVRRACAQTYARDGSPGSDSFRKPDKPPRKKLRKPYSLTFPQPDLKIGNRFFWSENTIRAFEALQRGVEPPEPDPNARNLNSKQVREHFGNISHFTLWRWLKPDREAQSRAREKGLSSWPPPGPKCTPISYAVNHCVDVTEPGLAVGPDDGCQVAVAAMVPDRPVFHLLR